MRRLSAGAVAFIVTTALAWAQNSPPGNPPPKAPEAKRITGVVTPDRVNENLEKSAKRREAAGGPTSRGSTFFLWYADNPDEFSALARYSVLFLAVLTQKPEEMPVKRVYIRTSNGDVALAKLSSWSSKNADTLLSTKIYGPNREDGFYLFPTAAAFRDGQLQLELSGSNPIIRIVQLPINDPPERVAKFPREDARPGAKPELRALQTFLAKKTSGFPMPRAVP
jgi:hypothetical protein